MTPEPSATYQQKARDSAHAAVAKAVAIGLLIRPAICEIASPECRGEIEAAHYDYEQENRLCVRWLCRFHHVQWDTQRRRADRAARDALQQALDAASPSLLTVGEVSNRLHLNRETVRRWLRAGKLRGVTMGSDKAGWRIPESEADRVAREGMHDYQ